MGRDGAVVSGRGDRTNGTSLRGSAVLIANPGGAVIGDGLLSAQRKGCFTARKPILLDRCYYVCRVPNIHEEVDKS